MTATKHKVTTVRIADLDISPAESVRAYHRPEAIAEYAGADAATPGCLPPVDVFAGPTKLYCGDGSHRAKALARNRRTMISALVRTFASDAAAQEAAKTYALTSNQTHGCMRSVADKRKVIETAILLLPPSASDQLVGKRTGLSRRFIRLTRERLTQAGTLTGPAAAGHSRYPTLDPAAAKPGARTTDGAGRTVIRLPDPDDLARWQRLAVRLLTGKPVPAGPETDLIARRLYAAGLYYPPEQPARGDWR